MFFALKGPNFDANHFAEDAIKKGARYAIVDNPDITVSGRYILVENALATLQKLARYHRQQLSIPVIGITGSNGKTTTKELIYAVLSKGFKTKATSGNLNNHIGVPLTLLDITEEHEIAIVEMGANHPGEISFLCQLSKPTHALITNIGKAHLEGFGTFENVIAAKRELYDCTGERNGLLFVNRSDQLLTELSSVYRVFYYLDPNGLNGHLVQSANGLMQFHYEINDYRSPLIKSRLIGNYNLSNAMAAVAVGIHFQISHEKIKEAIEGYEPKNNRSQWTVTEKNELILDAYNANPTSTLAALQHFKSIRKDAKLAILGDMLELGSFSLEEHQKIVDYATEKRIKTFFVGKEYGKCQLPGHALSFTDTEALIEYLKHHPIEKQTILLKGSRGIGLEKALNYL